MEDQGAADQTEGEARRDESDKRRGCEDRKNSERSAPRPAPPSGGHLRGIRSPQYLPLEDVIGNVHAHEERCVERRQAPTRAGCAQSMPVANGRNDTTKFSFNQCPISNRPSMNSAVIGADSLTETS